VAAYHAGSAGRDQILVDWSCGKIDIVVATVAFGMGSESSSIVIC
jgi:superfamily II DNA helicase RecQ